MDGGDVTGRHGTGENPSDAIFPEQVSGSEWGSGLPVEDSPQNDVIFLEFSYFISPLHKRSFPFIDCISLR